MTASRDDEIAEVDAFLAAPKRLLGTPPQWQPSTRKYEMEAIWPIEDEAGVVRAQLRFRCHRNDRLHPSVSLLFRDMNIWRADLEERTKSEPNPPWAPSFGLPYRVYGSHAHEWPDNKEHVRLIEPKWSLPARREIPPNIQTLPNLLPWFCERVNLELAPEQRGFDVPPQTELNLGGH